MVEALCATWHDTVWERLRHKSVLSRDWFVASSHEFDENKKLEKHVYHLPAFLVFSHHPNFEMNSVEDCFQEL